MVRTPRGLACLATALSLLLPPGIATAQNPAARTLYEDALAREQAVRTALADPRADPSALKAVRSVVADFEAIVRRYPTSAYCDDALWHAGQLSLDAFGIFEEDREKAASLRLLRALASEYPASRLARQVPAVLARMADPPAPAAAPKVATIRDIRRAVLADTVRVTIELDSEVSFHDERLEHPARVFVDLPMTRAGPAFADRTLRFEGDADLVRQVRVGRHPNSTTRVVLDVDGISSYSVYPLYSPYRLVIDCIRATAGQPPGVQPAAPLSSRAPAAVPVLSARSLAVEWGRSLPTVSSEAGSALREARAQDSTPPLASRAIEAAPARAPTTNLDGGFTIARQLGLGVSRIVIDPGHGGHDPGASGKGATEAEIVLDVALRLERLLAKAPGIEVVLTRRTDAYVPLQERTMIANREGADLFLSIHTNASPNTQAHGIETYFLNFASTRSAEAVAARENAVSGQAMAALPDLVKAIALSNKLDESRDFATYVQRAMIARLRGPNKNIRDLGVKQAPFVVLIGAAMPSVLAEISFLTNAQEVRLLRGPAYRQRIAEALRDAIRTYQTALKSQNKVAQQ